MQPIESRELRGVTMRLVWSVLAGVGFTVATILGTYFSLRAELQAKDKDDAIQDVRLDALKSSYDLQQIQIREMSSRVTEYESRVKMLELNLKQQQ